MCILPIYFAVTYDPRLPSVTAIVKKHYSIASENPDFKDTFPNLPLVGYRRSKNLGEYLTRAKLYPLTRCGLRTRTGFVRCTRVAGGQCSMCKFAISSVFHQSAFTGEKFDIQSCISCVDTYIIYSVTCRKCPHIQYIGQTTQPVSSRFSNHLSDIHTKKFKNLLVHILISPAITPQTWYFCHLRNSESKTKPCWMWENGTGFKKRKHSYMVLISASCKPF